jgi:Protein of unknown function (DUF2946)
MRRCTALLALAAIVLHALAPFIANAAADANKETVELCTAHGVVAVQVDAGGPYAPRSSPHCPACACHGMAAAGFQALPVTAAALAAVAPIKAQTHFPAPPRTAARPRAPPLPA